MDMVWRFLHHRYYKAKEDCDNADRDLKGAEATLREAQVELLCVSEQMKKYNIDLMDKEDWEKHLNHR